MEDEEKIVQGVVDTIDAAKDHRYLAAEMLQHLEMAKSQVNMSRAAAHRDLQATFSTLRDLVDKQLAELMKSVNTIADSAIESLNDIEEKVKKEDDSAINIMNEGKGLLFGDHTTHMDQMRTFKKNEDNFKETNMPEVPALCDVCSICVDFQPDFNDRLETVLHESVNVIARPPVKISQVLQRPGALMVYWAEVDDDSLHPFGEYRLQYCQGNAATKTPVYLDAYKGELTCHTIRHLCRATKYLLRVCGRVDKAAPWCTWSIPCDAITMLPHYEWQTGVDGYTISNENKMATRESQSLPSKLLHSCSAAYTCGHSISFKVVEVGATDINDGIALSSVEQGSEGLRTEGAIFVNTLGQIFMDGDEKLTQLPQMARGSTLTFDTDLITSNKVRVNIEMNDKVATFDWCLPRMNATANPLGAASGNSNNDVKLFFAANFKGSGWKVGVE